MKTKTLLKTQIITTLLTAALTATTPAQNPGETQTAQIVFVPKKMLEENRIAGKLKENTFYWTNIPDDPEQGPKVAEENGTQYLLLKGTGTETTTKSLTVVTLIRVFNVPKNATSATISGEIKHTYDEWIDQNPSQKNMPTITFSFLKDGKEARANSPINSSISKRQQGQWVKIERKTDIPLGAQQLVITAKTDHPNTLGIAYLNVTFDNKPLPSS